MCTKVMVCHGDRANVLPGIYSEADVNRARKDSKIATYYITRDGKYAVDADYVSIADLEEENLNLDGIPKIELSPPKKEKKKPTKKST